MLYSGNHILYLGNCILLISIEFGQLHIVIGHPVRRTIRGKKKAIRMLYGHIGVKNLASVMRVIFAFVVGPRATIPINLRGQCIGRSAQKRISYDEYGFSLNWTDQMDRKCKFADSVFTGDCRVAAATRHVVGRDCPFFFQNVHTLCKNTRAQCL